MFVTLSFRRSIHSIHHILIRDAEEGDVLLAEATECLQEGAMSEEPGLYYRLASEHGNAVNDEVGFFHYTRIC